MDVTPFHWVFAGCFAIVFIIGISVAYASDRKKSPAIFNGSWRFLLTVFIFITLLIVVKILTRF